MARPIPDMDQMTAAEVATDDSIIIDDTSAGETKRINVGSLLGLPVVGWISTGEVHTFTSFDTTTRIGVIAVPAGATNKYTNGMRYRLTQATGGTKYAIIHAVANTSLTLFFPIGTTLNNETISTPYYSPLDTPFGFPRDRELWKVRYFSVTGNTANTPTKATWYKPMSAAQLTIGTGKWSAAYTVVARGAGSASSWMTQKVTLSTTTSSETNTEATSISGGDSPANGLLVYNNTHLVDNIEIAVAGASTLLHLLHHVDPQGATINSCGWTGQVKIEAYSAYIA